MGKAPQKAINGRCPYYSGATSTAYAAGSSGDSGGGGSGGSRAAHYKSSAIDLSRAPRTFADLMNRKAFKDGDFEDFGYTPTHNMRTKGNRDWRNLKTGEQYIFDLEGALVVDELNHGTRDKVPPDSFINLLGHLKADAWPHVKWGNGPKDPSSPGERLNALLETVAYGTYWRILPEGIRNKKTQRWIESVTR